MNKRRATNIIGVVVLGAIILGVTIQRFVEQKRIRDAENYTVQQADKLAKALVDDSSGELVLKWAKTEYVDAWGNPYVIEHNGKDKGACVRSYGLDGKPFTEDDIVSRIYHHNSLKITKRPMTLSKMGALKKRLERKVYRFFKSEEEKGEER